MSNTTQSDELDRDVRILQRNLAKGFISRTQLDKQLADLPDVADQGEWFDPTVEAGDTPKS